MERLTGGLTACRGGTGSWRFNAPSTPVWSVNRSTGENIRHAVHINTLEGAWGLFKRQVYGIHHHVSVKHLDAYLGEMCYR
jgi:hypothetical protein